MRRLITVVAALMILVGAGFFVNRQKQPTLKLERADSPISGYLVDGRFYSSQQKNNLRLGNGEHSVRLVGPLLDNPVEIVKLSYFKKLKYEPEPKVITKESLAKKLADNVLSAGYATIGNVRMTEDKLWMVYYLLPKDGQGDGETEIYNFLNGTWASIASGTTFELDGLSDNPLPPAVIKLLQNNEGI